MSDFPEVNPALDSSFALPPDTVAYYTDDQEHRSRLTSFFRFITVIPHIIFLWIYGIAASLAVLVAWFAIVFTAKYPEGIYSFVEGYQRYYVRVYAYAFLITDAFPPFSGSADEPYAAHFLLGPPVEKYSRLKTFFRFLLVIPFGIVAYVLVLVAELVSLVSWFAILFTGKQPQGIQDALNYCFGFVARLGAFSTLLTEDWPKFNDDAVNDSLAALGYAGTFPPAAAAAAVAAPAAPPVEPPAPPTV